MIAPVGKRTFEEAFPPSEPLSPLVAIPKDLLQLILHYLPTIQDVSQVLLSCRMLSRRVSSFPPEFFRKFIEDYHQPLARIDENTNCRIRGDRQGIQLFKKYAPHLRNLKIHIHCNKLEGLYETLEDFQALAAQAHNITELDWEYLLPFPGVLEQQMALLDSFKNLTSIRLCVSGFINIIEPVHANLFNILARKPTLHTCTIYYMGIFNDEFEFESIPWPHLKHLKIYIDRGVLGNFFVTGKWFSGYNDHFVFPNIFKRLQSFGHLESFSLLSCPLILGEGSTHQSVFIKNVINQIPIKKCELQFIFKVKCADRTDEYPFTLNVTKSPEFSVTCRIGNTRYVGPFNDYLPHGNGQLVSETGQIVFEGEFFEGLFDVRGRRACLRQYP